MTAMPCRTDSPSLDERVQERFLALVEDARENRRREDLCLAAHRAGASWARAGATRDRLRALRDHRQLGTEPATRAQLEQLLGLEDGALVRWIPNGAGHDAVFVEHFTWRAVDELDLIEHEEHRDRLRALREHLLQALAGVEAEARAAGIDDL